VDARYVAACSSPSQFPSSELSEVAIAGRSNCGKSSLINAVTGRSSLARTSSTPGRTRQLLWFRVSWPRAAPFHLVDLPGYGYAQVSRRERESWDQLVTAFIERRAQLRALLLLNDLRRDPAEEERGLLRWCDERGLAALVVLTKADKLARNKRFARQQAAREALGLARRPIAVSVRDKQSIAALREQIGTLLRGAAGAPDGDGGG